jgi:hypothetical protein
VFDRKPYDVTIGAVLIGGPTCFARIQKTDQLKPAMGVKNSVSLESPLPIFTINAIPFHQVRKPHSAEAPKSAHWVNCNCQISNNENGVDFLVLQIGMH